MGLDDRTFSVVAISAFMQIMYILQLPELFGPTFSPFASIQSALLLNLQRAPETKAVQVAIARNGDSKLGLLTNSKVTCLEVKSKKKKKKGKSKVKDE